MFLLDTNVVSEIRKVRTRQAYLNVAKVGSPGDSIADKP